MSSSRSKGGHDHPAFVSKTPHFFAIILKWNLQEKKLPIPKKFVKKYGKTLSNMVLVKLPCGSEWKMELKHDDGKVCFQKDWQEFTAHYSIDEGHLLVFQYEGNSKFHVVILDKTCTEIDYPPLIPDHLVPDIDEDQQVPRREEVEDDDVVEIFEDISCSPKMREKPSAPCSGPHNRRNTSPSKAQSNLFRHKPEGNQCEGIEIGNSKSKGISQSSNSEIKEEQHLPTTGDRGQPTISRKRKYEVNKHGGEMLNKREKHVALQKSREFKSDSPFFKVVMQPSYIEGKGMSVPTRFARRHLSKDLGSLILRVSGEQKTWIANYIFRKYDSSGLRAILRGEWMAFARENNLEVGDVCVFVLHRDIEVSFEVVIFHENGNSKATMSPEGTAGVSEKKGEAVRVEREESPKQASKCMSTPQVTSLKRKRTRFSKLTSEKFEALEKVKCFKSEKPYFSVVICPSHLTDRLSFPFQFTKKYLTEKINYVALKVSGQKKTWSAKCTSLLHTTFGNCLRLSFGWLKFARENTLEVGDVCIFVLHKDNGVSFEVIIFRDKENSTGSTSQGAASVSSHESEPDEVVEENPTNETEIPSTINKKSDNGNSKVPKSRGAAGVSTRESEPNEVVEENPTNETESGGTIYKKSDNRNSKVSMSQGAAGVSTHEIEPVQVKEEENPANETESDGTISKKSDNGAAGVSKGAAGISKGASGVSIGIAGVSKGASGVSKGASGVSIGAAGVSKGAAGVSKGASGVSKHEIKPVQVKEKENSANETESGGTMSKKCDNGNSKVPMSQGAEIAPVQLKEEENPTDEIESVGTIKRKTVWTCNEETGMFPLKSDGSKKPSSSRGKGAAEEARNFFSTNPCFRISVPLSQLKSMTMNAPHAFCRKYLEGKTQVVSLQVRQRSWHVKMNVYQYQWLFGRGWPKFVKDNSLRQGDVCFFELIKTNPAVFKVHILG
ncbi:hypothetical protein UlMin_039401 [Ulmus minor]